MGSKPKFEGGRYETEGWANYATWNIALWADNKEPWYLARCAMLDRLTARGETVQIRHVRAFVRDWMGGSTPDIRTAHFDGGRLRDVDWQEIADNWETERKEQAEYQAAD